MSGLFYFNILDCKNIQINTLFVCQSRQKLLRQRVNGYSSLIKALPLPHTHTQYLSCCFYRSFSLLDANQAKLVNGLCNQRAPTASVVITFFQVSLQISILIVTTSSHTFLFAGCLYNYQRHYDFFFNAFSFIYFIFLMFSSSKSAQVLEMHLLSKMMLYRQMLFAPRVFVFQTKSNSFFT